MHGRVDLACSSKEALTPEADFTRFVKADVDPGVQRAALKKLFADPQFNVMDGLDVYIDDYNKPDPMPAGMLEKIVGVYDRRFVRPQYTPTKFYPLS